jgi:hypothetical protein
MLLHRGAFFLAECYGALHVSDVLSRPWPYVDSLKDDQEDEAVIDAQRPLPIGSCGHHNCDVCRQWTAYPQSHFLNWTIKPVTKCKIERVVRYNEHPSTIYGVDVLENGIFKNCKPAKVTSRNKREYWNKVLQRKASSNPRASAMSYLAFSAAPGYVSAHYSWTTCPALYCKCSELGTFFYMLSYR